MTFRFSVTVDGVVFVAFEVLDIGLVDLGVMVLELDSFFLEPFFFGAGCGGMDLWWNGYYGRCNWWF